jgi:hypothetical protein
MIELCQVRFARFKCPCGLVPEDLLITAGDIVLRVALPGIAGSRDEIALLASNEQAVGGYNSM